MHIHGLMVVVVGAGVTVVGSGAAVVMGAGVVVVVEMEGADVGSRTFPSHMTAA